MQAKGLRWRERRRNMEKPKTMHVYAKEEGTGWRKEREEI
jgi:hypothetical protein